MKKLILKTLGLGALAVVGTAIYLVAKDYLEKDKCCDCGCDDDYEDEINECCLTKEPLDKEENKKEGVEIPVTEPDKKEDVSGEFAKEAPAQEAVIEGKDGSTIS